MMNENPSAPPPLPRTPAEAAARQRIQRRKRRDPGDGRRFEHQLHQNMPTAWVTIIVVTLNLLVFVWMLVDGISWTNPSGDDVLLYGADYAPVTTTGEWWRLVTSGFAHFGIMHITLNMLCLCFVGPWLERLLGHAPFAVMYVFATIISSLTSILWQPDFVLAGASGAIFGVFGAFVIVLTKLKGATEQRAFADLKVVAIFFLVINLLSGFGPDAYANFVDTDNAGHVGGALAGLLAAGIVIRRSKPDQMPPMHVDFRLAPTLLVPLVVGILLAANCVDEKQLESERLYEQIDAAEHNEENHEGLALSDKLLELHPDDASAHGNRGYFLGGLERWDEALIAIDRAIAIDNRPAHLHNNRAWFLSELERFREGAASARQALAREPDMLLGHQNLLICLDELDDRLAYRAAAAKGVSLHPEEWSLLNHHSFALHEAKDIEGALHAINSALAQNPDNEWARQHKSILLREREKPK